MFVGGGGGEVGTGSVSTGQMEGIWSLGTVGTSRLGSLTPD